MRRDSNGKRTRAEEALGWRLRGPAGVLLASVVLSSVAASGSAQEIDMEEMSKKLDNPLGDLWLMFVENDTTTYKGFPLKDTEVFNTTLFQPVMPVPLTEEWNLINRPIIPLISAPLPTNLPSGLDFGSFPGQLPSEPNFEFIQSKVDVDRQTELGDIMFFSALAPAKLPKVKSLPWDGDEDDQAGLVYGLGPAFIFPTATNDLLASKKWSAGPVAVLTYLGPKWTYGALWLHWWDIGTESGGKDKPDVNKSMIQYFIWYNLPNLWAVGAMPVINVNFEASSGNKATVPIGLGVSKTLLVGGKLPMRIIFETDYSVVHPDDIGSRWNFRLALVPVLPNPFKPMDM